MATKSFLKEIKINNRKSASSFISALENAEQKGRKDVTISKKVKDVTDAETIRKIFGV